MSTKVKARTNMIGIWTEIQYLFIFPRRRYQIAARERAVTSIEMATTEIDRLSGVPERYAFLK
jgi:hypothetical protein